MFCILQCLFIICVQHQKELERVEPNGNWYLRVFGNEMKYGNAKTLTARAEKVNFQSIFAQLVQVPLRVYSFCNFLFIANCEQKILELGFVAFRMVSTITMMIPC